VINLGDGTTPATLNTYYVNLQNASSRLNFNGGVFQAYLGIGTLIFGPGSAYIQSGGAVIDSVNFTVGNGNALLQDPASTGGGLTKIGTGTLILGGANTYTGATTVSNGVVLLTGSIGSGAVNVVSGAELGGNGTINGPVTVAAGATLWPGLNDTSTLTINNTLNLAGTASLTLNRTNAQNASKVSGVTTLTQGGTLTVVNAGDPVQAGDSFTLFSASSVIGSFATTNLPSLGAGLQWNFSGMVLSVAASVNPNPTNIVYSVSGGNLTLTWPVDHLGWYCQSNSVSLSTPGAWYDIPGSQTVTSLVIPIQPGTPKVFYRMSLLP
jgi:autotransporter-associated beta strand protein